jgi:hypothetical protein
MTFISLVARWLGVATQGEGFKAMSKDQKTLNSRRALERTNSRGPMRGSLRGCEPSEVASPVHSVEMSRF